MTTQAPTTAGIPAQAQSDEPATPPAPGEYGSRTVKALEGAWEAIRAAHPEVPHVVMITGRGLQLRGADISVKYGHFGADMWNVKTGRKRRAPELFASGELLSNGGRKTMETLLHEAAHAVAHARKVADTSSDGRYHNKKYVAIAEELGLRGPERPVPIHGWNDCTITDETAQKYKAAIEALDAAQLPYLYDPLAGGAGAAVAAAGDDDQEDQDDEEEAPRRPKKRGNTRFLIICQCTEEGKDGPQPARRIQISRKSWAAGGEDGGLMCGVCKSPFEPAEPIDPDEDDE
ncbi:hypothetical protein ABZ851_37160 [Streptomyces sp. NPDC047049]|uniref:hypothetical protein n=1 Tax=Streptomyces sp. NPDC047049 TaxID=3156688 RepID=UPI0033DCA610